MRAFGSITISKVEDGVSITVQSTSYQAGTSPTTAPTGSWSSSPVSVSEGQYLWTRVIFTDGTETYGVSKQGTSATDYELLVSHSAISKAVSGTYNPTTITLSAKYHTGSSNLADYAGRFKVETTADNTTWTVVYTSSSNQNTYTYTIPSSIIAVRCSLYMAGGTSVLLDQQTVPIVNDGATGVGVSSLQTYYYLSTSNSTQTGGSWSTTPQAFEIGRAHV